MQRLSKTRNYQWFQSWSTNAPGSPLAGPSMLIFLTLLIGPCIVNWITRYIRKRVEAVEQTALKAGYAPLQTMRKANQGFN